MSKAEYGSRKRYHYMYITINVLNGKYYYGMHSTNNMNDGYMGSGKRLKYSINKYGKTNHRTVILESFNNRDDLRAREREIVTLEMVANINCLNLVPGGFGGFDIVNMTMSKEERRRRCILGGMGLQLKIKNDSEFRYWLSAIRSVSLCSRINAGVWKCGNTWSGKTHTTQSKLKISQTKKGTSLGLNNSQYGTHWITNGHEDKKLLHGLDMPDGWKFGRLSVNRN